MVMENLSAATFNLRGLSDKMKNLMLAKTYVHTK